jgi:predicted RNase H-like HicB family nuclease
VLINTQIEDGMTQRFYPAVLERGEGGAVGLWFPDFPGCVVAAHSQEEAMARASDALADAMRGLAERDAPLPEPTPLEAIGLPPACDVIGFVAVGATPPDPSERVNVYLPKSLIERADRRAAELGMNRSSFFGFALSQALWDRHVPSGASAEMVRMWFDKRR